MTRIELPDGAWAVLFDPLKVPERRRRPVIRALVQFMKDRQASQVPVFDPAGLTEDKAAEIAAHLDPELLVAADDLNDQLVVALVSEWSFGEVSVGVLLDVPADAYKALSETCQPLMTALMPNFQVSPDPLAVTGNSR